MALEVKAKSDKICHSFGVLNSSSLMSHFLRFCFCVVHQEHPRHDGEQNG